MYLQFHGPSVEPFQRQPSTCPLLGGSFPWPLHGDHQPFVVALSLFPHLPMLDIFRKWKAFNLINTGDFYKLCSLVYFWHCQCLWRQSNSMDHITSYWLNTTRASFPSIRNIILICNVHGGKVIPWTTSQVLGWKPLVLASLPSATSSCQKDNNIMFFSKNITDEVVNTSSINVHRGKAIPLTTSQVLGWTPLMLPSLPSTILSCKKDNIIFWAKRI